MKRFAFIFLILCSYFSFGQYSNDWISHSQKYYRMPITTEGIYRVTYSDLVANGIAPGLFDHRNLQVYHNGKTLPLFVSAQSDGIFRSTDYFEFYAEGGNTGWLDSTVYYTGEQLNKNYSLYNDTASYYLTFANTLESPRYDTTRVTDYNNYVSIPYILRTERADYVSTYNATNTSPYIVPAEGWCDAYFDLGGKAQKDLITPNYVSVGVPSQVSFGFGGFSETRHDVLVTLGSDPTFNFDTTYFAYNAVHKTIETSNALPTTSSITFQSYVGGSKAADKNGVAYVQIKYPSKLSCDYKASFGFTLPKVMEGDYIFLDFEKFNSGKNPPIIYCPEINKRIRTTVQDGKVRVLMPNMKKELHCFLVSQNVYYSVPTIKILSSRGGDSGKFIDYSLPENQGDYIIITEKSLWKQANLYRLYRQNSGHKVVLVDIEELYNQFSYGIKKHPYSIIAFLEFAKNTWSIEPTQVFLIGRGYHLPNYRNNETMYAKTLVPTMGNPASDLLYTVSPQGESLKTSIAIGRLAAETVTEVENYRIKVLDYESQKPNPWMKTVLHFGGGSTAYEQSLFRHYLSQYERQMEGEFFGADVHSFYKESSDVYETTEPEAIRGFMNAGTSMLTFFGHASGSGFDQSIDHPSLFDNKGKYPLILANSCYSGDIFADNDYNVSRTWVLIQNKGAIGFLANVGPGQPNYLNIFSSAFIKRISNTSYGEPIGICVAKSLSDVSNKVTIYSDLYEKVLGFALHGDPAVALHAFEYPDLALNSSSLFFTPNLITTDLEEATFNIAVQNRAKAYSGEYTIKAVFTPANSGGTPFEIDTVSTGSYCNDTVRLVLDMSNFRSGEYTVAVTLDYLDTIPEISESNNTASYTFFVSAQEVIPIYPPNYAIIPTDTISFQMSSVDAFNPPNRLVIEMDTTHFYTSPFKQTDTIDVQGRALISWTPEGNFIDGKTYFWRVSSTDSIKWNEASFTYEKGESGWAQIHRGQFTNNTLSRLSYNDTTKKYSFLSVPHEAMVQTRGNCETEKEYFECLCVMDATLMGNSGFPLWQPSLHIFVVDSTTMEPWRSNKAYYGQQNYPTANGSVRNYLDFKSNNVAAQQMLASFLLDTVPDGSYVFGYSFKRPYCQSWDDSLKKTMDSLGFSSYQTTPDDYPYIFYMQKGNPSSCVEVVGKNPTDLISLTKKMLANYDAGYVQTPTIGPATEYSKIVWSKTATGNDKAYLTLSGVTKNEESYILENIFASERDRLDTVIKTSNYPCMQMSCSIKDVGRTPIDLNYWKVYYTPAAELAISPEYAFSFYSDTLQQGDTAEVIVSAKNVSPIPMDSVLVMYEIRNEQNELVFLEYKRVQSVEPYSYVVDTLQVPVSNYSGTYSLRVEFNPINPQTGEHDQAERIHLNNTYHHSFYVKLDKTLPVLDITVDGRHIINGDNVSASPEIYISLFDENRFFSIADTSLFTISLKNKTTGLSINCYFADSSLILLPDSGNTKIVRVLLEPNLVDEGTYELRVQARDVTGNATASKEYVVEFEYIQERAVSVLYNFPNPFRDFTTFRFVLTGMDAPNNLQIQISDAEGRVVNILDLQNVHVGTNSIDVYWDGRDKSGLILPSGVYFYRLVFDNQTDWNSLSLDKVTQLNKKGGKLFLLR